MNEETIVSKIMKYNHVKGKMPGIQLEDLKWYNATERTEKYVTALKDKVGCRIEIQHADRNISFVKLLEADKPVSAPANLAQTRVQYSNYQDQERNDMIIRQTCVKAAAELMKIKNLNDEETDFYEVCKRMEKYIHTGE